MKVLHFPTFFWYLRNIAIGVIMNFRNIQKIFCDFLVKILYFEILLYDCCLSKGSRATANEQIKKVWKKQSKSKWKVIKSYLVSIRELNVGAPPSFNVNISVKEVIFQHLQNISPKIGSKCGHKSFIHRRTSTLPFHRRIPPSNFFL